MAIAQIPLFGKSKKARRKFPIHVYHKTNPSRREGTQWSSEDLLRDTLRIIRGRSASVWNVAAFEPRLLGSQRNIIRAKLPKRNRVCTPSSIVDPRRRRRATVHHGKSARCLWYLDGAGCVPVQSRDHRKGRETSRRSERVSKKKGGFSRPRVT